MTEKRTARRAVCTRSDTRFVALDRRDQSTIVAQGRNAVNVVKRAKSTGTPFVMSFVPKAGQTYVL